MWYFMDQESYEQFGADAAAVGDAATVAQGRGHVLRDPVGRATR